MGFFHLWVMREMVLLKELFIKGYYNDGIHYNNLYEIQTSLLSYTKHLFSLINELARIKSNPAIIALSVSLIALA